MTEKNFESENSEAEQTELQKLFEERQKNAQQKMGELYDEAEKQKKSPIDLIMEDVREPESAKEMFGQERIEEFLQAIQKLKFSNREEFIDQMMALITPFNHDRFFNPEVRENVEKVERRYKFEVIEAGSLDAKIHPSD